MKITNLPASDSFTSGDVLAIEINGKTYKLTGATLAAALEQVGQYVTASDLATTTADGLMSASDKYKLNGIASGAQVNSITGVKGNAESSYRTGNVNLTPANIGAVSTAAPNVSRGVQLNTGKDYDTAPSAEEYNYMVVALDDESLFRGGVYSIRATDGRYRTVIVARKPGSTGNIWVEFGPRIAADGTITYSVTSPAALRNALGLGNTSGAVPVANGGTGATTWQNALKNLHATHGGYVSSTNWDALWSDFLSNISTTCSAVFALTSNAASALSNGKVAENLVACISRSGSDASRAFRIMASNSSKHMYSWSITGVSNDGSSKTFGTVYRFTGTAL